MFPMIIGYNLATLFIYYMFRSRIHNPYTNDQLIGCLIGIGGVLFTGVVLFWLVGQLLILVFYFVIFSIMLVDLFKITK